MSLFTPHLQEGRERVSQPTMSPLKLINLVLCAVTVISSLGCSSSKQAIVPQRSLIAVFHDGRWQFSSANGQAASEPLSYGQAGDVPVASNWLSSDRLHLGVFRAGAWFLDVDGNGDFDSAKMSMFGLAGDIPVVGDWDNSGKQRIGVFRKGNWIVDTDGDFTYNAMADKSFSFGLAGDLPVIGDWDNSGKVRIGVFRNGSWILDWDGNHEWNADKDRIFQFGLKGDIPVVGDWGDGKTGIGVFRGNKFLLDMNHNFQWDSADKIIAVPMDGGYPVAAALPRHQ